MKNQIKSHFGGFTLIELLVVVLIIGVLTAIAIPQYQTAVQKSRYATLMPLAKSVKNAEEAMLMSNGQYSSKLEDLSITLPGTVDNNKVTNSDGTVLEVTATDSHNYVKAKKNDLNNYVMYFAKSTNFPNEIHCEALKDNKVAKQVCLSYGPTSTTPITGTDSNYDTYVLEGSGSGTGSALPTIYSSQNGIEINEGDICNKCNDVTLYGGTCDNDIYIEGSSPACQNVTAYEGGKCISGNWGCNNSTFNSGSSCEGNGYAGCGYSVFNSGSFCKGNNYAGCGNSTFNNGSICYAEASGSCYNNTYNGSACCLGDYCPSSAPKC